MITDRDCFPLTKAEADQLAHLLYVASGGLVDLQSPPPGLAGQPVHRRPYLWVWHLAQQLNRAGNDATLAEQESFRRPGGALTPEQIAGRQDRLAEKLMVRLEEHDRGYRAKQAAAEPQA